VFAVEVISAAMSFIELRRITFEKVDDLVAHRLVPVGLVAASKEQLACAQESRRELRMRKEGPPVSFCWP
jgi:hypothetical protein